MSSRAPEARARGSRVVLAIAQKELREVIRDGRFWAIGWIVAGLLAVALAFGLRQARAVELERSFAQSAADEHWREQGDKNPHVAAHYGTYVFKPAGPLPFIDPGVEPFVGASIKLEAHRRNDHDAARAEDGTGLSRFAGLTVASVLQLLLPLLTIGLGFSTWTMERERGTLRQLASLGVSRGRLVAGKALGIVAALMTLLLPALLVGALVATVLHERETSSSPWRAVAMAAGYLAYFAVFVGLTLAVSARSRSSRAALVALLSLWVITALIAPRAATDIAELLAPTPSHALVAEAVRADLKDGLPGGPGREERIAALTEELLERQGFKGAEMLMDPALLSSIELSAEAAFESEVLDHHHEKHAATIERQERIAQYAAIVSPVVAIRSLSMALAGTDYAHHRRFADAAETHRRALVAMLNREIGDKGGSDAWSYKAGRELWERAPVFQHVPPDLGWVLREQRVSILSLGAWWLLSAAAAWLFARRIQVV